MGQFDLGHGTNGANGAKMAKNGTHAGKEGKSSGKASAAHAASNAIATSSHATTAGRKTKADAKATASSGVPLARRFTQPGVDPLDEVVYERRSSAITNPDGMHRLQDGGRRDPARAGASSRPTSSSRSTSARRASTATRTRARRASARSSTASRTRSARRARSSAATSPRKADADAFEAELSYLLVNQVGAFNSPVWFNCGLWHEYRIAGSGGNWAWNMDAEAARKDERAAPGVRRSTARRVETGAPTSGRSARRASSRPSNDDLMCIYEL